MMNKGTVSAILEDGKKVTVKPYRGEVVTVPLVVPYFLENCLEVGMPVIYTTFEDNTGILISRVDGDWKRALTNFEIERIMQS